MNKQPSGNPGELPTPRTDSWEVDISGAEVTVKTKYVPSNKSRTLERELAAKIEEVDEWRYIHVELTRENNGLKAELAAANTEISNLTHDLEKVQTENDERWSELAAKDAVIRGLPHTADGRPIMIGDKVWFENPNPGYYGDTQFVSGKVDCIYSPVTFEQYKGHIGIQTDMEGDSWDGGNLDCWSSKKAAEAAFAQELDRDHASQLKEDRRES